MAQLIQCDFCGNITNQIAAKIRIDLADVERSVPTKRTADWINQTFGAHTTYNEIMDQLVKDCCVECLKRFIDPKPTVLTITATGEPIKKEDL